MRRSLEPVSIEGIEFDALIDSQETYTAEAPTYPTENANAVTVTLVLEPLELSMTLFVTDTPVTWKRKHGVSKNRVITVCNNMIKLFTTRQPLKVSTSEKDYSNMVITSLTISKTTETGYAREIPITLKEITVVSTKTTTIDPSYMLAGDTQKSTGTANTGAGNAYKGGGTGYSMYDQVDQAKDLVSGLFSGERSELKIAKDYLTKTTVKPQSKSRMSGAPV